ncbi:sigma factor-like helix-turn-helix DNA-binding protein [Parapedobacter sp. 10938]|uniref:sigma factor-like helix-turn-helix DNA-binding protein n=1 Tax=Parapedobacter flavus TaxID=3110225 RepID=UPI002DBFF6FA|nr:sigma factor-like helix-turn-helix DNA-binding protein [Parapedobacter sp. 10938]MEC3878481.1 sigma factor-like helix-turn-helix DNA-binding protein [Parapedobacter sp. 10938]
MLKTNYQTQKGTNEAFHRFKAGNEAGLNYFYHAYYDYYEWRAERFVKDDVVGNAIAQEGFLRLWLMRDIIRDVAHLHEFLGHQLREAGMSYYRKNLNRFHRSMLRLDGIEDFQEFMLGYELEDEAEEDAVYLEQLEAEKHRQLEQVNRLLPNLTDQQQLFLRLCLRYSFNYERIAYHLGGISDYEVAQRVEQCIANLKAALADTSKLDGATRTKPLITEGMLTEEQAQVLAMRYDLQYSFEEIAAALQLDDTRVKSLFVQAYAVINKAKQSA